MRALVATVFAGLVAATAAQAARTDEGASGIYAVGVADRKLVELVEDPTGDGAPIAPSWAGDAGSIVFARLPGDGCASEIRLVPVRGESDGLGVVIANGLSPSVSATGRVLFVGVDRGLYVVPLRGGKVRRVLVPRPGAPAVDQPNVSQDGRRVVFVRHDLRGRGWIETVRMDGSGRRRVTRSGGYANPVWSPDARRLAFARQDATGRWGICVTKADGSGLRVIRHVAASDSYPTWSPDGTRLAFVRELRFGHALYVVNVDGSGLRRLTPPSVDAIEPAWSPDGGRIAFVVNGGD
jgi:TolB protein